jgi:hypothetical protein
LYELHDYEGGVVARSVVSFRSKSLAATGNSDTHITEPERGRILGPGDTGDPRLVTTFTATPQGDQAPVNITSSFGASGVADLVERIIAPRRPHHIYVKGPGRIDAYAHVQLVG